MERTSLDSTRIFSSTLARGGAHANTSALSLLLAACALAGCPTPTNNDASNDANDATSDLGADVTPNDAADVQTPDGPTPDATDAPVVDASDAGNCRFTRVIVGVSDYATFGGYVVGDLNSRSLQFVPLPDAGTSPIDQDHNVRASTVRCETYDLWHTSPSHLVTLDPANLTTPLHSIELPDVSNGPDAGTSSANPYDIAVITATKAYVVQYNSAEVAIVNPMAGSITGHISLAALADADGLPEATSITVVGTHAFVALQQLDRPGGYTAPAHSHVAVIDTGTDALVDVNPGTTAMDAITLTHGNPMGDMPVTDDGTRLLVASIGNYGDPASGIDVIDASTYAIARSLDNLALGGKISSVAVVTGAVAWATVDRAGDAGTMHSIIAFNIGSGNVTATPIAQSATYSYGTLRRAPDGNVWAIGSDYNMGSIHAFDPAGTALLSTPFTTGSLNTTSLDFLP